MHHANGTIDRRALLTASSSIYMSLRCAVAIAEELGEERPDWELSIGLLAHAIASPSGQVLAEAAVVDGLVLPGAHRCGPRNGCGATVRREVGHVRCAQIADAGAWRTGRG